MTMFMAIHPDKASAYSCGSEYDGYVCCNSYHTFGHGNYLTTINGTAIEPRYVSIGSGFTNSHTTAINNVINSWNPQLSTSADSIFYLIKQPSNCQIQILKGTLENGLFGYTHVYNKAGLGLTVNNKKLPSNYSSSIIYIDTSKGYFKTTVAHELGHAMGLAHRICNINSIMYPYIDEVKVSVPQTIDAKTVKHIYSI